MICHITHELAYRYTEPVSLNPHTLYLYPRMYPYQRLLDYELLIDPQPSKIVRNVDVEGNVQQLVYFSAPTDHLTLTARMRIQSDPFNSLDFVLFPFETGRVPFRYPSPMRELLASYLVREGVTDQVETWARGIAAGVGWQTVPLLTALTQAIRRFQYEVRDEGAPLSPAQTLTDRRGSCRDYAVLYVAACRSLGIAARFVSGYLFGNTQQEHYLHAWAEVYLPGAGWRGFDPTENLVVVNQHIFLASSARAELTTPVEGSYSGQAQSSLTASVLMRDE